LLAGLGLLLSTCVLADPVSIGDGQVHEGNIESSNDIVRIGDGARVNGDIESRNAPVTVGENAEVGDIESRNGQISLGRGARAGNVSTRNGTIQIGQEARAGDIDSRNGMIEIGSLAGVGSLDTRNGAVQLAAGVQVNGSIESRNGEVEVGGDTRITGGIETRNGGVDLDSGSEVSGSVVTRNGTIKLESAVIGQSARTRYGDIRLYGESRVGGDVVIEIVNNSQNSSWMGWGGEFADAGEIVVTEGSVIEGNVIVILDEDFDGEPPRVVVESGARVLGSIQADPRTVLSIEGEVMDQ
jgi:hypothetical protein